MAETLYQVLDRIQATPELALPPNASPLDFLFAIFRDPLQPMPRRMQAAIQALPFTSPKLSVIASVDARWADKLEQAIRRSRMLEATPEVEGDQG